MRLDFLREAVFLLRTPIFTALSTACWNFVTNSLAPSFLSEESAALAFLNKDFTLVLTRAF